MSTGTIIWIIVAVLVVCCCFTHRRVIRALVKHEPILQGPEVARLGTQGRKKRMKA